MEYKLELHASSRVHPIFRVSLMQELLSTSSSHVSGFKSPVEERRSPHFQIEFE
jgi:hypothetical protein